MLKDRISINQRLQQLLREASLWWGVKIDAVEVKDVDIPEQMQRAIANEAAASRESGPGSSAPKVSKRPR